VTVRAVEGKAYGGHLRPEDMAVYRGRETVWQQLLPANAGRLRAGRMPGGERG